MTTCTFDQELLSAYMDGETDAAEASEVSAHLSSCSDCQGTYRAWSILGGLVEREREAPVFTAVQVRRRRMLAKLQRTGFVAAALVAVIAAVTLLASDDPAGTPGSFAGPGLKPLPATPTEVRTKPPADPRPAGQPSESPGTPGGSPSRPSPGGTSSFSDGTGYGVSGMDGELDLTLRWFDGGFEPGEKVEVRIILRNISDAPVSFDAPRESPVDVVITDSSGEVVASRSSIEDWDRGSMTRTLRAGEAFSETIMLRVPSRPGSYELHGRCECREPSFTTSPAGIDPADRITPFETQAGTVTVRATSA